MVAETQLACPAELLMYSVHKPHPVARLGDFHHDAVQGFVVVAMVEARIAKIRNPLYAMYHKMMLWHKNTTSSQVHDAMPNVYI